MILKQLKAEALNMIHIHCTVSSLRRACSMGNVKIVEATDELPKLYYITDVNGESIHALNSDLTKFLMLKHIESAGTGDSYSLKGIKAHWVETEEDYNLYVDSEYRESYSWEDSKASMPWVVLNITKPELPQESTSVNEDEESEEPVDSKVSMKISFSPNVTLKETVDKVGTVSEDRHSVDVKIDKYLMFEAINDLGLSGVTDLIINAETEDAIYSAKVE